MPMHLKRNSIPLSLNLLASEKLKTGRYPNARCVAGWVPTL